VLSCSQPAAASTVTVPLGSSPSRSLASESSPTGPQGPVASARIQAWMVDSLRSPSPLNSVSKVVVSPQTTAMLRRWPPSTCLKLATSRPRCLGL
jgi:hypothetical protein